MTKMYKVKVDVIEKSTSTREEIIKAESANTPRTLYPISGIIKL